MSKNQTCNCNHKYSDHRSEDGVCEFVFCYCNQYKPRKKKSAKPGTKNTGGKKKK